MSSHHKAHMSNPALGAFSLLIGEWTATGSHPMFPDTVLPGRIACEWIEGGAFLRMRAAIDHESFPAGVYIFGSDDALGTFHALYFDERGVSRKLDVRFDEGALTWWRNAPGFSQRYRFIFDGDVITCKGELSADNLTWQPDLSLTCKRVSR